MERTFVTEADDTIEAHGRPGELSSLLSSGGLLGLWSQSLATEVVRVQRNFVSNCRDIPASNAP